MSERSNDITLVVRSEAFTVKVPGSRVVDDNRKCWPPAQILPDGRSVCADELEVETAWRGKYYLSPSSAYMRQSMPLQHRANEDPSEAAIRSAEVKYFKEDFVWERLDRQWVHAALGCTTQGCQQSPHVTRLKRET